MAQERGNGYTCPQCGAALKTSAKNWVYCPNKYRDKNPCNFKGYMGQSKAANAATGAIKPLDNPSEEQSAIFTMGAALLKVAVAAFIIIARAGSGKTTCLVQLVRIWASQNLTTILLCFARRDKFALQSRIPDTAGKVLTSNGAGLSIVSDWARCQGKRIDLNDDVCKQILNERLRQDGLIPKEFGKGEKWKIKATTYSAILAAVNHIRTITLIYAPAVPSDADFMEALERFDVDFEPSEGPTITHYASFLFREVASLQNALVYGIDFCGQTFLPVYHNLKPSRVYQRVAVDECQDQNPYNRAIAFKFVAPGGCLVAVGDEFQAIYEWRGADSDAIGELRKLAEARGEVQTAPLTVTRRCCRIVTRYAQTLVPDIKHLDDAPEGEERNLESETHLLEELKEKKKGLVICRMNGPIVSLCLRLLAVGVSAVLMRSNICGQLLTLVDNLSEGKDGLTVSDLLENAKGWLEEALAKAAKKVNGDSAARIVQDKYDCLAALASVDGIKTAGQLKNKIISLFPQKDEVPDPKKRVVLSTVHGAKGGESHTVYLLSPTGREASIFDAIWSSARDRDNTLYVAVTRCERELVFVGPKPTFARFADIERDADLEAIAALPEKQEEAPAAPVESAPSSAPSDEVEPLPVKIKAPRKARKKKVDLPGLFE